MGDYRDSAGDRVWYEAISGDRRQALYDDGEEERWIPIRWETCPTCEGRGTHVNPAIDSHGISPEEFAEDPEFAEAYHRGVYDVPCYQCGGERVVPVPTRKEDIEDIELRARAIAELRAAEEAERRMGA